MNQLQLSTCLNENNHTASGSVSVRFCFSHFWRISKIMTAYTGQEDHFTDNRETNRQNGSRHLAGTVIFTDMKII